MHSILQPATATSGNLCDTVENKNPPLFDLSFRRLNSLGTSVVWKDREGKGATTRLDLPPLIAMIFHQKSKCSTVLSSAVMVYLLHIFLFE